MTVSQRKIQLNLNKLLHKNQRLIFKQLRRFNVLLCGRRFGKSRLLVFILFFSALRIADGVFWHIFPTHEMGIPIWKLYKKITRSTFPNEDAISINETTKTITFPNGTIIVMKSADKEDGLRGDGLNGVAIDEIDQIKRAVWEESIRPALMDKKGFALLSGTPRKSPFFRELYEQAKKEEVKDPKSKWKTFHFSSYDNPLLDPREIDEAKKDMSEKQVEAEIMANFVSVEGNIFKPEWFQNRIAVNDLDILETYISFDTASVTSENAAYTCGIVAHLLKDYRVFMRKVIRKKLEYVQLEYAVKDLATQFLPYNLQTIIIENKSTGTSLIQTLRQTSQFGSYVYSFNPKGSKEDRANVAAKWCEKDMVVMPYYHTNEKTPEYQEFKWMYDFEEEIFDFPNGIYKDQVDAFSMLMDYLSNYFQLRLNVVNSR